MTQWLSKTVLNVSSGLQSKTLAVVKMKQKASVLTGKEVRSCQQHMGFIGGPINLLVASCRG